MYDMLCIGLIVFEGLLYLVFVEWCGVVCDDCVEICVCVFCGVV